MKFMPTKMTLFWKKYRFEIGLFVFYALLALAFTYPLVLNLGNSIYGVPGDHFGQLWESWWRKNALLAGESLSYTPLIYAPTGFDFSSSPLQPLPMVFNLGLTLLTNEVLALNILLLLSFPLAGLAVYLLVKKLTGNRLAGAFSGLVYAFSMYHISHAWEHSSLISIYWMPFYVLALVNFDEKKNIKSAIIAALLFALVLLDNFYYGFTMVFFSGFFFLFRLRKYLNWRSLKLFLLFAFCSLLFVSPFILPIVKRALLPSTLEPWVAQGSYERSLHDLNWFSARPWFYILPSSSHPLWGRVSKNILDWLAARPPEYLTQPYARMEHNLFLGWTAILLSATAVVTTLRTKKVQSYIWLFLFLGIIMMGFSAPPMVSVSGFKIYFPAHFLYKVLPMFRAYARFGVLVLLCVAVLAGFGLKALLKKIKSPRRCFYVSMFLCSLVILEVLLPPFNVDLTPPPVYQWLKEQPGDFIIIEFPPRSDHSGLLYQRVHGKRLFNPAMESPFDVLYADDDQVSSQALLLREFRERPDKVSRLGVKYLIAHEGDPFLDFNLEYFGGDYFKMVQQFPGVGVYEVCGEAVPEDVRED